MKVRLGEQDGLYLLTPVATNAEIRDMGYTNRREFIEENEKAIQTDWDYPGVASTFGWTPCKECRETDGTVDCAHHTASEMISSAREWLDDHIGKTVDDPGYFSE